MGELDNTLVIYIWGDNGASMEGTETGTFNELTTLNGIPLTPEQQLEADRAPTAASTPGAAAARAALLGAPGPGPATPRSSGASRWPRTSAARATRWSSRGRSGSRTTAACAAVHRTASTSARPSSRSPGCPPDGGRRHRADADARDELRLHLRRRRRARAAHAAVLRDLRQPRDVQGRLDGLRRAADGSPGRSTPATMARFAPEEVGPGQGPVGALRPATTTSPRPTTSQPSTPRSSRS